jgi:hypothetical protein
MAMLVVNMRGKSIITGLTVAVIATVIIAGLSYTPAKAEISFETGKPSVPDEIWVLKKADNIITENRVTDVASIFGVRGDPVQIEAGWLMEENGSEPGTSRELRVYEWGGFRYLDQYQMSHRFIRPEDFPSDNECAEIADQFIENLRNKGFIPQNLNISFNDVVADTISNPSTTYFTNKHVNYSFSYDGLLPFVGGMAKLRVYLNENGEITGFFGDFYQFENLRKVQVLQPEDAILNVIDSNTVRVQVESIRLVYLVGDPDNPYIEPLYDVIMKCEMENGFQVSSAATVPAFEE